MIPTPIPRRALHDETADRLRALITDGELAPGEKIAEKELCERFQVSRTPLREALKVLASDGLVVLTPNRGAHVSRLTLADLAETFPVMGALEGLSGELACVRISAAETERIAGLHDAMVERYKAGDLQPYFQLNQQIHEAILAAAENPTLTAMHRGLAGRVRRARYVANMTPERWAQAVAEHEEMIVALRARDSARLGAVLRQHLANKFETVREALQLSRPDDDVDMATTFAEVG
ncbi:MAG: GntR family transcriptional regulator [Pseudomonadota bacterium]